MPYGSRTIDASPDVSVSSGVTGLAIGVGATSAVASSVVASSGMADESFSAGKPAIAKDTQVALV